ncbi:hypothetical protein GCM10009765_84220 [Fodinicola feengrottensis]|uniref:Uncharacterized protein n=1 Tax=Fodinicola feengrottensis TaxID=435914 RepID=A0ABN2JDI2_9ACTN
MTGLSGLQIPKHVAGEHQWSPNDTKETSWADRCRNRDLIADHGRRWCNAQPDKVGIDTAAAGATHAANAMMTHNVVAASCLIPTAAS